VARLKVSVVVDAPPDEVWADLADISSHVEWMVDAVEIRFTSPTTEGVGTTFECETKVGPFHLTDLMEVTSWEDGRSMGVRHVGLVTGEGAFKISRRRGGRTKFVWREQLHFPWWMGGPLGAWISVPVLTLVWRRSMRQFAARFA
jgi:hypothetical protein